MRAASFECSNPSDIRSVVKIVLFVFSPNILPNTATIFLAKESRPACHGTQRHLALKLMFKYMNRTGNFNLIDFRLNAVAARSHAGTRWTNANSEMSLDLLINVM